MEKFKNINSTELIMAILENPAMFRIQEDLMNSCQTLEASICQMYSRYQ